MKTRFCFKYSDLDFGSHATSIFRLCGVLSFWVIGNAAAQTPVRELGSVATPPKFRDELVSSSLIQDQAFSWSETPRESTGVIYNLDKLEPRRWTIQSSLSAGYTYEDNVGLGANAIGSAIYNVSPTVAVKYGPMGSGLTFGLSYTANYQYFENNAFKEALNHAVTTNFNWDRGRLRVFGAAGFTNTAGANVDAGSRIDSNTIFASLGIAYNYTEKTTFGLSYTGNIFSPNDTSVFAQNNQVINQSLLRTLTHTFGTYFDYQITGKTKLGLEAQYGIQDVDRGNDLTFYRFLLRANWAATSKLTLNASLGPQLNQPEGEQGEMSAYWNLGIDYRLVDTGKTTFGLNIYRNQNPSISLVNQSFDTTGISASLTYLPASRLRLSTAFGYEFANYFSTSSIQQSTRQDHMYFIRPALVYAVTSWASLSVFYQYTENHSSGLGSTSFRRNSFGVAASIAF